MNDYYAPYDESLACFYCKKHALVQLSSDVTCSHCGTEQGIGHFVYNFYEYNHQTYSYDRIMPEPLSIDPAKEKKQRPPSDIFLDFANTVPVPDNIIQAAKDMYKDYISVRGVHIEEKQYPLVMACIYFTSRAFSPISRKKLLSTIKLVEETAFTNACNELKERFSEDPRYNEVLFKINKHDISHYVNRAFSEIFCISKTNQTAIRSMVFKMHARLKPTPELATLDQSSIVKALIYLAARANGMCFKENQFAHEVGISKPTLTSTKDKVRAALC